MRSCNVSVLASLRSDVSQIRSPRYFSTFFKCDPIQHREYRMLKKKNGSVDTKNCNNKEDVHGLYVRLAMAVYPSFNDFHEVSSSIAKRFSIASVSFYSCGWKIVLNRGWAGTQLTSCDVFAIGVVPCSVTLAFPEPGRTRCCYCSPHLRPVWAHFIRFEIRLKGLDSFSWSSISQLEGFTLPPSWSISVPDRMTKDY